MFISVFEHHKHETSLQTCVHTNIPVGDFKSRRGCELVVSCGFGSGSHATELFIVILIHQSSPSVLGPAIVPGAHGPVALLQVHSIQVSIQLKWHWAGPALSRHSLSGFPLWRGRDRGIWIRWERGMWLWHWRSGSILMKWRCKSIDHMKQYSMLLLIFHELFTSVCIWWINPPIFTLVYHLMAAQTHPSHLMHTSKASGRSASILQIFVGNCKGLSKYLY